MRAKTDWLSQDKMSILIKIRSVIAPSFFDMSLHKDLRKQCKGSHSENIYSWQKNCCTENLEVLKSDLVTITSLAPLGDMERAFYVHKKCNMQNYIPALNQTIAALRSKATFLRFKEVIQQFYLRQMVIPLIINE